MYLSLSGLTQFLPDFTAGNNLFIMLLAVPVLWLMFMRLVVPALLSMLKALAAITAICLLLAYGSSLWEITHNAEARVDAEKHLLSFANGISKEISSYEVSIDIQKTEVEPSSRSSE